MSEQQQRDEMIESVKAEISHNISPLIGWLRMDAVAGVADFDGKRHDAYMERLQKAAEDVVKVIEKARS